MTQRVLFCDDDPDIREVIALSLGLDAALDVKGCEKAEDMLEVATEWHPDLVLLDVMMPGMDGPTALGELMRDPETRPIPVVFMTARTQVHEREHFVALGAAGVIAKPFDPMTLASQVRRFMAA
ncbi:Two-component response regulator [Rhodovulum sp. PH10]|uniref:response regulator n=1 Tax=Rhodovulum sp. PH10 TaxID=1187851 RepID=UPI00027C29F6|nr:response regulator [Rhodovulum sp. PH10]EJW12559.1 Two-component response regulator [Rhodovulum sp. PH10]